MSIKPANLIKKRIVIASNGPGLPNSKLVRCDPSDTYTRDACLWANLALRANYSNHLHDGQASFPILIDGHAKKDAILKAISDQFGDGDDPDLLVFVWLGHGGIEIDPEGVIHDYIVTSDIHEKNRLYSREIAGTVRNASSTVDCIFIFDNCRIKTEGRDAQYGIISGKRNIPHFMSGLLSMAQVSFETNILNNFVPRAQERNMIVVSSCRPGEFGKTGIRDHQDRFIFSWYLMRAIETAPNDSIDLVIARIRELYVHKDPDQCPTADFSGMGHRLVF